MHKSARERVGQMQALTARWCQWSTAVGALVAVAAVVCSIFIAGTWINRHSMPISIVGVEEMSTSTGIQGQLTRLFGGDSCKNSKGCSGDNDAQESEEVVMDKNRSDVDTNEFEAVKEYWEAAACQEFYVPLTSVDSSLRSDNLKSEKRMRSHDRLKNSEEANQQERQQERTKLPVPIVSEDFYKKGGRRKAMEPNHVANEVVISNAYKFIYVENRKGASSTIREALKTYFNISWSGSTCPVRPGDARDWCLFNFNHRCTSMCLDQKHIESYFFFSFVRDPVDRFVSGYKQAWHHRFKKQGIETGNVSHMNKVLDRILKEHYHTDEHLETQAMSLGTRWMDRDGKTYRIPLDFIGRVENLEEDFKRVMDEIQKRNSKPLPKGVRLTHANQGGKVALATRQVLDSALQDKILSCYAQDRVCFGY